LQLLEGPGSLDPGAICRGAVVPDGTWLVTPRRTRWAAKVGLSLAGFAASSMTWWLVGARACRLAAAVYGATKGCDTLVIEPDAPGGQAGWSSRT